MSSQIILYFNQFLSAALLSLFSLFSPLLPSSLFSNLITINQSPITYRITRPIATPSAKLQSAPSSALLSINSSSEKSEMSEKLAPKLAEGSVTSEMSIVTSAPVPWGTTEKIGDHLYRTYVGSDPKMGTPGEILTALNSYRHTHNASALQSDDGLCKVAQMRADQQDKLGTLDQHKGLVDYMADENHWRQLNITAIGENASYGYVLSGVHLIEWVFDSDEEHKSNQLNPQWNLACPAVAGVTVDIIFAKR